MDQHFACANVSGLSCRPGRAQAERVFVLWLWLGLAHVAFGKVRVYDLGNTFLTRWPNMSAAKPCARQCGRKSTHNQGWQRSMVHFTPVWKCTEWSGKAPSSDNSSCAQYCPGFFARPPSSQVNSCNCNTTMPHCEPGWLVNAFRSFGMTPDSWSTGVAANLPPPQQPSYETACLPITVKHCETGRASRGLGIIPIIASARRCQWAPYLRQCGMFTCVMHVVHALLASSGCTNLSQGQAMCGAWNERLDGASVLVLCSKQPNRLPI